MQSVIDQVDEIIVDNDGIMVEIKFSKDSVFTVKNNNAIENLKTVKKLVINDVVKQSKFPPNLETLVIRYGISPDFCPEKLPKKLKYLRCDDMSYYYRIIKTDSNYKNCGTFFDGLPQSLLHLDLPDEFNGNIENLPFGLTHLYIGKQYNKLLRNLPTTLTHLMLNSSHNLDLEYLPSSITHLAIESGENQNNLNFPVSVKYLFIRYGHNEIIHKIPPCVEFVALGFKLDKQTFKVIEDTFSNDITCMRIFPKSVKYVFVKSLRNIYDTYMHEVVTLSYKEYKNMTLKLDFSITEKYKHTTKPVIFYLTY